LAFVRYEKQYRLQKVDETSGNVCHWGDEMKKGIEDGGANGYKHMTKCDLRK